MYFHFELKFSLILAYLKENLKNVIQAGNKANLQGA